MALRGGGGGESHGQGNNGNYFFRERNISKGLWPRRSSFITSVDLFVGFFIRKERVYQNHPRSIQLKVKIENAISSITAETLIRVSRNMVQRTGACIQTDGGHLYVL
jgi:hypothetical protein